MPNTAYILRGAPASGKGTIAQLLIERLTGNVAHLDLDAFRWNFHLHPRQIAAVTDEEHQFAYGNLLALLERYCKNGNYQLVIEGLFSWDTPGPHGNMQDIITILKQYQFTYHPYLLQADRAVLWQRNKQRAYTVPRAEFDELYDYVMKTVGNDERVIEVSGHTPEQTVAAIISAE